jgi:hypothetical protein
MRLLWLELVISPDISESRFCAETYFRLLSAFISCHSRAIQPGPGCWMTSCTIIMRIRILGEYSRIFETWFDSYFYVGIGIGIRIRRIFPTFSKFEFAEYSRIRIQIRIGRIFPTPDLFIPTFHVQVLFLRNDRGRKIAGPLFECIILLPVILFLGWGDYRRTTRWWRVLWPHMKFNSWDFTPRIISGSIDEGVTNRN